MRIAVLSNTNVDYLIRLLQEEGEVFPGEGYGNELGALLNPASAYHAFSPQMTFLLMDLLEVAAHELDVSKAAPHVEEWFREMRGCISEGTVFYISDAVLLGDDAGMLADFSRRDLEAVWNGQLRALMREHSNVRVFPLEDIVRSMGTQASFSSKTWYMGRIMFGMDAQKKLAGHIRHCIRMEQMPPKKVLLLDLDNTVWGGLAGENDARYGVYRGRKERGARGEASAVGCL